MQTVRLKHSKIDVSRPQIFKSYNNFMGGVDLHDNMITYYQNKYRTNKWTLKTIVHFDLASVNSWLHQGEKLWKAKKRDCDTEVASPSQKVVCLPCQAASHIMPKIILQTLHASHQGIVQTKALACGYVWWPGLDKDVEQREICRAPRTTQNTKPHLHVDFAGAGVSCSLVATHGLPDVIVSDNGTAFTSMAFRTFASNNGIRLVTVASYYPSSNGQAEQMVLTTKEVLQQIKGSDLARLLLTQHITQNATTGSSPAEMSLQNPYRLLA
ncbi:hypothetical protein PR048_031860 [Dryococelus australis]|uniref:RNA-directed DNA polymerase n=1 Tax=Dryococelus australis TaxID=614101 RepID=A0ABQ9GAJ1_9NEOP|nr:hypothetical protein PR048_031860 [Dryococelus australis]